MNRSSQSSFDAAPAAQPLFKERVLWAIVLGLFFFLIYGSANEIADRTAPHPSAFWDWERNLPFVPELIVPYMSSDLVFVIAFLLTPTRDAIQRLGLRYGLAITTSALLFLIMPLEFGFTRPEVTGWPKVWFNVLSLDKPYNQFPSLHISLGFLAWHTIVQRVGPIAKFLVTGWFMLILVSTIVVFQHHFIDLPGGALIAGLVFWLVPESGRSRFPIHFVSPRHLHMAFRYLVIAAGLVILAFSLTSISIVATVAAIGVAASLLFVAIAYVLGANRFLRKTKRGYPLWIWLLNWPYLAGSFLNWRYWRTKVPLMAEVTPGIWVGARPGRADWNALKGIGIAHVIDLVPELPSSAPADTAYSHFPLLDIAIPNPKHLDDVVTVIDDETQRGPILIHCALGMSRSVLAVCAWLIKSGKTIEQAFKIVDQARPERVSRPYMKISLELYEQYIREKPEHQMGKET